MDVAEQQEQDNEITEQQHTVPEAGDNSEGETKQEEVSSSGKETTTKQQESGEKNEPRPSNIGAVEAKKSGRRMKQKGTSSAVNNKFSSWEVNPQKSYSMRKSKRQQKQERATRKMAKFQPTYQLGPTLKLYSQRLSELIAAVAHPMIEGRHIIKGMPTYTYDTELALPIKSLANSIKEAIKLYRDIRHRVVVTVTVVQNNYQTFRVASRCLWSPEYDTHATYVKHMPDYHVIITAYLVYTE